MAIALTLQCWISPLGHGTACGQTAIHEVHRRVHRCADHPRRRGSLLARAHSPVSADLPSFRYHPDPVASGSIRESTETCACCERSAGWIYTATFCTAQDVDARFCPWCIADGSAAERFEGEFTDLYGLDGVGAEILERVARRTPGIHAWQDPHWLVHCNEPPPT
ncbi:hypothetical protein CTZ27_11615 [Streptomyces griseocarneus]|nr:hypothetical protein CTZ27_11615 [Streptomyces griseocarneus]